MRWRRGADGQWRVIEWTRRSTRCAAARRVPSSPKRPRRRSARTPSFATSSCPDSTTGPRTSTGSSSPAAWDTTACRWATSTATGSTTSTSRSPTACPTGSSAIEGDGTFEDVTEAAGARDSRPHVAVALRGRGQRRRPGPDPAHAHRAAAVRATTARAASRAMPTRSTFKQPLQGSLTSAAMADYDRDGFLDLYLCAYGYFIGVSEDKAGPPSPYHDAQNGSPNVLLRNDGHGRFVDVTDAVGLDAEQRPLQLRAGLGRLRRGRLARPARRERLRPQEPVPQRGPGERTGRASRTSRRRPASRTTARA